MRPVFRHPPDIDSCGVLTSKNELAVRAFKTGRRCWCLVLVPLQAGCAGYRAFETGCLSWCWVLVLGELAVCTFKTGCRCRVLVPLRAGCARFSIQYLVPFGVDAGVAGGHLFVRAARLSVGEEIGASGCAEMRTGVFNPCSSSTQQGVREIV